MRTRVSGMGTYELAHPEGKSSNALFETLSGWEHQLKALENDIRNDLEGPRL